MRMAYFITKPACKKRCWAHLGHLLRDDLGPMRGHAPAWARMILRALRKALKKKIWAYRGRRLNAIARRHKRLG